MSFSPAAADPPQFKYQVCRIAEECPLAKATNPPTISHIEERLLRLEARELERQRAASKHKLWMALGIVLVAMVVVAMVVVVVLAIVCTKVAGGPETPLDWQVPNPTPVVPSSAAPTTTSPVPLSPAPVLPSLVAPATTSPVPPPTIPPTRVEPTPATSPVPPPPPPARVESVLSYINTITLSNQTLSYPPGTPGTAEERAVQWLIEDDLTTATDDLKTLRQRYALSILWFIPTPAGFGSYHADTWTTNPDECAWLGVLCDDDHRVTSLSMSGNDVWGRIPDDLGLLTANSNLDLPGNKITGTIPSSLAAMTDLGNLNLNGNRLTGTIPSSLGVLTALIILYLQNNQLTGTIPSSMGTLTALTYLDLSGNELNGTIPTSLGLLTAMPSLQLQNNRLNGTIPSSLAAMTALTILWLENNTLTGTIPSSLAAMTALTNLQLRNNQLTGTIPSSFRTLKSLTNFLLFNNQLNGTLPLCDLNRTFEKLVADCAKVSCPCCTHCCPTASEDRTIPIYGFC
jgi:Leucine-rich repeat (LRR) protein